MEADREQIPPAIRRRALRVLVILARRSEFGEVEPVPAIDLANWIGLPKSMGHETRRRRIREAIRAARSMLREQAAEEALVADGRGYWLTMDRSDLRGYLGRRRRHGLSHLAEESAEKRSVAADHVVGQGMLFGEEGAYRYA